MFKKLCFVFGILVVSLCSIRNVDAETYDDSDFLALISGKIPITADDTLTVGGNLYIGANGAFTITDGSVTFSLEESDSSKRILMTVDGDVSLNEGEKFFIKIPDILEASASAQQIEGFSLDIKRGSNFDIDGTMIIPNVGNGRVSNEGTVNVNGAVELRSLGNYTSSGITNVNGKFVIYGIDGNNIDTGTKFTINDSGAVYSDFDFSDEMFVSGNSNKIVVPATVKDYDSVTDSVVTAAGNNTFAYGYELGVNKDETIIPDNNDDKVTDTDVTTDKNNIEKVENPKTFDGIYFSMILGVMALIGLKVISKKIVLNIN